MMSHLQLFNNFYQFVQLVLKIGSYLLTVILMKFACNYEMISSKITLSEVWTGGRGCKNEKKTLNKQSTRI